METAMRLALPGLVACVTTLCLVGCAATSERVTLRNQSGQTVTCGPYSTYDYSYTETSSSIVEARLRGCISDYQRQGYERVPQ